MSTEILVGRDECRFARGADVLVARELTSDWAVAIHHPATRVGALVRFSAEPDPGLRQAIHIARAAAGSFAGTGHGWLAYLIGGASAPEDERAARLAHSSRLAAQATLWRAGILVKGEDAGGTRARFLYFDPVAGRLIVRSVATLARAAQVIGQPTSQPTNQPITVPCPLAS